MRSRPPRYADDDAPSRTHWERMPLGDDGPTVMHPVLELDLTDPDPDPTIPSMLPPSFDEVPPSLEVTRPLPPRRPPPAPVRRMIVWTPPEDDGARVAVKSGLAGLAVGLAILVPMTAAAVFWSWSG